MEERLATMPPEAMPARGADAVAADDGLDNPKALQILSTEHWALLAARSLVYNEAFVRAGMFLTFLSASLVALGLVATATGFTDGFLMIAAVLLGLDLFIGYASLGRIASASSEDILYLQAMSRIRHAYVEMAPGTAPYFLSGHHDDPESVLAMYGPVVQSPIRNILHGFTTTPGMIGTITNAIGGALAGVLTMLATHDAVLAGVVGAVVLAVSFFLTLVVVQHSVFRFWGRMRVMFPKDTSGR